MNEFVANGSAAVMPRSDPFPSDAYNEAFEPDNGLREHWRSLFAYLGGMTKTDLDQRQERGRRMRHEDGATFNPFDDTSGRGTPWALEMIPLPVTADDWSVLEKGILQRTMVLERVLEDTYGPQSLIRDGYLPPELVFANPRFLHACHGLQPAGGRYLTYYAADLYRGPDGRFRVLRDYGANPAGLGYALENRIVVSRLFPEEVHKSRIHRLAPFFHTFKQGMIDRSPGHRDNPSIVLLSPGPESRIYFEHALLSRYLGYPLVEGQDLTVRNGEVFLKKLAGLEPVDVIFRHIADAGSDPFTLRKETGDGVAGLIQACREQRVEMLNPIGSGFVDTPALSVFLPRLCRHLLGSGLLLENHPRWWCGDAASRQHVLDHLGRLTVSPSVDASSFAPDRSDWQKVIEAEPYRCLASEQVKPSMVPAWKPQGTGPRYCLIRVFACASGDGFSVMPGGLAITADNVNDVLGRVPERQSSKDIWVLSEKPVAPFSLLSSLQTVEVFKRDSDLPSRVADNLLWLGRYLERAEGLVRLLRSVFRRLSGEDRLADIAELPFLMDLLRAKNAIVPSADAPSSMDREPVPKIRELRQQLGDVLFREESLDSVVSILRRVQDAARNVRDRLSLDSWRVVNRLESFDEKVSGDALDLLDQTLFTLSAFSGLAMESMTRGIGWRFMDMGRRLERGIHQAHLIEAALSGVCADGSGSALEALLEVSDSIMTYRSRYRVAFQLAPVLDLLLLDEENPKSLAFQCLQLSNHVEHLPRPDNRRFARPEERLALKMSTRTRLLDLSGISCDENSIKNEALTGYLETIKTDLAEFARQISARYLTRIPATPHFTRIRSDQGA